MGEGEESRSGNADHNSVRIVVYGNNHTTIFKDQHVFDDRLTVTDQLMLEC